MWEFFLNSVLSGCLKLLIVVLARSWAVLLTSYKWVLVNSIRIKNWVVHSYKSQMGYMFSANLSCGPTKLTRTKGFVNLVNVNDSSCSDRTM